MPGSAIGEFFLEWLLRPLAELFLQVFCYGTGNVLLKIIGLDSERFAIRPVRKRNSPMANLRRAIGWRRRPLSHSETVAVAQGRRVEAVSLIGFLFWLLIAAAVLAWVYFWPDTDLAAQHGAAP